MTTRDEKVYSHAFERVLTEMPWAALCIDVAGHIRFANAAAARLLNLSASALLNRPFYDYLTSDSLTTLRETLRSADALVSIDLQLCLTQQLLTLKCVVKPLSDWSEPQLFLVVLQTPATNGNLTSALSEATAQCFDADDLSTFISVLQRACAPFGLALDLAVRDLQAAEWSWRCVSSEQVQSQLAVLNPEFMYVDVLAPVLQLAEDINEPRYVLLGEQAADALYFPHLEARTPLVKLLWKETCLVVPLLADKRRIGLLAISGPGLGFVSAELLSPFARMLGVALQRVQQTASVHLDQSHTALLLQANQAVTAVTELNDVLQVICSQAMMLTGGCTASLLTLELDDEYLRCAMALGEHSDLLLGQRSGLRSSTAGRVFLQQQHLVVDELLDQDVILEDTPFRSGLFMMLQTQGRPIGVLVVWHNDRGYFGPRHLHIVEQYCANAAVAIENAQLHEAMRRSEERYRTLFQNALEIVITLDLQGRITSWNRAALQFLRMSPAELRGGTLNVHDLLLPEMAQRMQEMQAKALEGQAPALTELEVRRPGGATAVIELTVQMLQERGQPTGVYIIGRDVTERRRQRQALTDKIAQLTALHELSSALSSSLERNVILQQAVEAIALTNQFDCVGIYHPNVQQARLELVASTGLDALTFERIRFANPGSVLWNVYHTQQVHVSKATDLAAPLQQLFALRGVYQLAFLPLVATRGGQGVLAIGRSGTTEFSENELQVLQTMSAHIAQTLENIQLYAEVEHNAARYRDLYENANDFIGTMTAAGQLTSLNRAALQFFGYTDADVLQLRFRDLLPAETAHAADEVLASIRSGETSSRAAELQVLRRNGTLAMLELRSRVVFDSDTPTAIHFIARDTTERRQLEVQVRQGEKLAALGQLVAGAAHELNNPLAVVLGTTQLLLRDPQVLPFSQDVRNIEVAAQRAKHIVKQLLTFAREQEDARAPVELPVLINRVLQGMRINLQRHAVQVTVSTSPDLPPIWGDAYQVEQVVDNLLHNAVQALGESDRSPRRIVVEIEAVGKMVRLSVSDNGPGIPVHVLPRIFDPFFTTKEVGSGTGLGLSLVFGIVDKHGGSIHAESVYGQGATFIVELPATQAAAVDPAIAVTTATNSTILVVEDEFDVRLILERALSQYGYSVDVVASAEAALLKIAEKAYDLVITDMRMPGMSGRELFERVRLMQPRISWVFVTGDTMSVSSETFLKQSGVPFLPKPFTLEELWNAVATSILRDREPVKAA